MQICTQWESVASVLQMTTGDIAQWVGAIGTLAAVWWAARTYKADLLRKATEEQAAREEMARQQRISAWRQAMMIRGVLELAALRLTALCETISESSEVLVDRDGESTWIISEAEAIGRLATDVTAFGLPVSKDILEFVSLCEVANEHARHIFSFSPSEQLNRTVEWPPGLIEGWRSLQQRADTLRAATNRLAEDPPLH